MSPAISLSHLSHAAAVRQSKVEAYLKKDIT